MAMIVVVLARRVRGILEHCVEIGAAEVADGAVVHQIEASVGAEPGRRGPVDPAQLADEGLIAIGQSLGMRIVLLIISEPDSAQASVKG